MKLVGVTRDGDLHVILVQRNEKSKRAERWYYERTEDNGLVSWTEVGRDGE